MYRHDTARFPEFLAPALEPLQRLFEHSLFSPYFGSIVFLMLLWTLRTGFNRRTFDAGPMSGDLETISHVNIDTDMLILETPESLDFLHAAGCTHVQGFHISRPLPAAAFQVTARQWL